MAESLLVRKGGGGLKLAGTELTLVADENIVKNDPIDIVSNKIVKAKATGGFTSIKNYQSNIPSDGFVTVSRTIPVKNSNNVLVLGTRDGSNVFPSVRMFSFNKNTDTFSAVSSRVDFDKGQPGTTAINNTIFGFQLNANHFFIHWNVSDNRWYGIVKFENNTLTITQNATQNFAYPSVVFLVMGDFLIAFGRTSSDTANYSVRSFRIQTNGTLSSDISSLSNNSVFGGSGTNTSEHSRNLIPVNDNVFAVTTFSQWKNSNSNFNKARWTLHRINLTTGALTKLTINGQADVDLPNEYLYGGAGFKVDTTNAMLVLNGISQNTFNYRFQDTGSTDIGRTDVSNLISLGALGGSTFYSSNVSQYPNLALMHGSEHTVVLGVNSSFNIIQKLFLQNLSIGSSPSGLNSSNNINKNMVFVGDENNNLNIIYQALSTSSYTYIIRRFDALSCAGLALESKNKNENIKILKFVNVPEL
jgi:hypothetical protein